MAKKNISNADICRILVDRLEINLTQFRDECLKIDSEDVPEALRAAIREFGIDVIHFINQYRMTDKSITDINKLPGRKVKFEERAYFKETINAFQEKNPNKFPTWPTFANDLDILNASRTKHSLSELTIDSRTYDLWKKWWKEGTFNNLTHD